MSVKQIFTIPKVLFYLIVVMLFLMTFDVLGLESKYLYFSTEIILLLFTFAVYFNIFRNKKWSDPPERDDMVPVRNWKQNAKLLTVYLVSLTLVLGIIWVLFELVIHHNVQVWFKSGFWYLYYVGIFFFFFFLVRKNLQHVNLRALFISVLILVVILTGYEAVLLSQGTGWRYNQTVIGWLLGVPVDNILFIYPIAPALCMVLYTIFTRHLNDLKAFWYLMALLIPSSIVVELIGIYPLNLWVIFNEKSIWPMGKTNIEEFIYYVIFQLMSVILYIYFDENLKRPAPIKKAIP